LNEATQAQIYACEHMQSQILSDEEGFVASLQLLEEELKRELSKDFSTLLDGKVDAKDSDTLLLEGKVDAAHISKAQASSDEVTRQLRDLSTSVDERIQRHASELKLLTEQASEKSSTSQVDMFGAELKAWVETACATHQKTITDLFSMFEQVRATAEAQNDLLNKHEMWMKDVQLKLVTPR